MAPDVVSVAVAGEYLLHVCFDTGEKRCFDMAPHLDRKCYSALKNKALFSTAAPLYGVVTWADGTDSDPDWLYEDSTPIQ